MHCFANTLQLVIINAVFESRVGSDMIEAARHIVRYLKHLKKQTDRLKEAQEQLEIFLHMVLQNFPK